MRNVRTQRRWRRRVLFSAAATLAGTGSLWGGATAFAVDRTWLTNGNGTFQVASNWSASLVPGAADAAVFDATNGFNNAYTVSFTGSVVTDQLRTDDNLTLNLGGFTYILNNTSSGIRVGLDAIESRVLTLQNGTFSVASDVDISTVAGGTAGLVVGSTARLLLGTNITVLEVGATASSVGNLQVQGIVSANQMFVGGGTAGTPPSAATFNTGGVGTFAVNTVITNGFLAADGGAVTIAELAVAQQNGDVGTVLINNGGQVTVNNALNVAQFGGSAGSVLISSGTLTTGSAVIGGSSSIGGVAGGLVQLVNTGATTRWNNTGALTIGGGSSSNPINGNGTVIVDGISARLDTGALTLAAFQNSNGTLTGRNGAALNVTGGITFGNFGGSTIDLSSGADLTTTGSISMANSGTAIANLLLRHAGTTLTTAQLRIGGGGAASVSVLDGAALNTAAATLGFAANGIGSVLVSGPGSAWISSGAITVSGASNTTSALTVGPGALVSAGVASALTINAGGAVTLDGGTLSVGTLTRAAAAGSVFDFNAGTLAFTAASGLTLGAGSPLGETLTLGAARNVNVTSNLTVAAGAQLALNGGRVTVGSLTNGGDVLFLSPTSRIVGNVTNAGLLRGSGTVTGTLTNGVAGQVLAVAGDVLNVGSATNGAGGRVDLIADGRLNVANSVANSGQIFLDGGVLQASSISNSAGGRISGRGRLIGTLGIANAASINFSGGVSDVEGAGSFQNNAGAKTIVTGNSTASFYLPVTNVPDSELRVSTGATAVFFDPVAGIGAFTGSGTVIFENTAASGVINRIGTTVVGASATLAAQHVRENLLEVDGRVNVLANGTSTGASRLVELAIDGTPGNWTGTLDLNDNDLIVSAATPSATVLDYIITARNAGAWNRAGLTSTAAKNQPQHNTTLGVLSGQQYHAIYGASAAFDGFAVADADTLVKYTYYGDSDFNGVVNFDDYSRTDAGFNGHRSGWLNGDFDLNGRVDFDDYALIDLAFNTQSGALRRAMTYLDGSDRNDTGMNAPALQIVQQHFDQFGDAYAASFLAAVPEPTSVAGCAAMLGVFCRRRRRAR